MLICGLFDLCQCAIFTLTIQLHTALVKIPVVNVLAHSDNQRLRPIPHAFSPERGLPVKRKSLCASTENAAGMGLFAFLASGRVVEKHKHRQVSGHPVIHEYRAVLTSPARELAGGISGTDVQGDDGLAPRNGVVWKSKPDLMGAVVLAVGLLGWPNGEHHPMGLSHG
jgi:hypothetical protein